MRELKSDVKKALDALANIRADLSYPRGNADAAPTTLQLIGFAVVVFVAAGISRYFGVNP